MTHREGDKLDHDEVKLFYRGVCPDCRRETLLQGPCGGGSINVKCGDAECGSRFNEMGPFGVERLSPASPLRPAEPVRAGRYR
jgi:hypothetical protein